jgi:hypothetical protein
VTRRYDLAIVGAGNFDPKAVPWVGKALELDPDSQRLIERLEANGIKLGECPVLKDSPADTKPRP